MIDEAENPGKAVDCVISLIQLTLRLMGWRRMYLATHMKITALIRVKQQYFSMLAVESLTGQH